MQDDAVLRSIELTFLLLVIHLLLLKQDDKGITTLARTSLGLLRRWKLITLPSLCNLARYREPSGTD